MKTNVKIALDATVWFLCLFIAVILRPSIYNSETAISFSMVSGALMVGFIWILLRAIIHDIAKTYPYKWLYALLSIVIVPIAAILGMLPFFILRSLRTPRLITALPLLSAGLIWGIVSSLIFPIARHDE